MRLASLWREFTIFQEFSFRIKFTKRFALFRCTCEPFLYFLSTFGLTEQLRHGNLGHKQRPQSGSGWLTCISCNVKKRLCWGFYPHRKKSISKLNGLNRFLSITIRCCFQMLHMFKYCGVTHMLLETIAGFV